MFLFSLPHLACELSQPSSQDLTYPPLLQGLLFCQHDSKEGYMCWRSGRVKEATEEERRVRRRRLECRVWDREAIMILACWDDDWGRRRICAELRIWSNRRVQGCVKTALFWHLFMRGTYAISVFEVNFNDDTHVGNPQLTPIHGRIPLSSM